MMGAAKTVLIYLFFVLVATAGDVLPVGKALKLEIETVQTLPAEYFERHPDRSIENATGTFSNTYISDGARYRMAIETRFGARSSFQDATTMARDGLANYLLVEPGSVLTIFQGAPGSRDVHTGERTLSPYQVFYDRNPLVAMSHWVSSDPADDGNNFTLDRLLRTERELEKLFAQATARVVNGKYMYATTFRGIDAGMEEVPVDFTIFFTSGAKEFGGWRGEARDRTFLREFTVREWMELPCGEGRVIRLPKKSTLTHSYTTGQAGRYWLMVSWTMKITSAALVDATEAGLFSIPTSAAKAIYDPKLGRQVPVGKGN